MPETESAAVPPFRVIYHITTPGLNDYTNQLKSGTKPELKTIMQDLGDSFRREFDECGIFNEVGEQPFAFAVRRVGIGPELLEVCSHRDKPFPDGVVEDQPILHLN